jgi:hypothetical protein
VSEQATCRHCGREIHRLGLAEGNAIAGELGIEPFESMSWYHADLRGHPVRGCRAASFDPDSPELWDPRFVSRPRYAEPERPAK